MLGIMMSLCTARSPHTDSGDMQKLRESRKKSLKS